MDFSKDRASRGQLVEITAEQYEYRRNVMPPRYARGCFAMGEPVEHTADDVTYHWAEARRQLLRLLRTRAQAERAFGHGLAEPLPRRERQGSSHGEVRAAGIYTDGADRLKLPADGRQRAC